MDKKYIQPLSLGGATLNVQYNSHPEDIPLREVLQSALESGMCNSIDTSPYYGDSELFYGQVLQNLGYSQIKNAELRKSLFVVTKCGRIKENIFDYSADSIKKSVYRSMERLFGSCGDGEYLDMVYLHDVEFQTMEQIMEALGALRDLKKQGKVRRIGCSGYPLEVLYDVCLAYLKKYSEPLDGILTYSNGCLQNNTFFDNWIAKFKDDCKIDFLANGSILSMSLLAQSPSGIKSFHPCQKSLRDAFDFKAKHSDNLALHSILEKYGQKLPLLATKFSIIQAHTSGNVVTVLGISNLSEWEEAANMYKELESNNFKYTSSEAKCIAEIQDFFQAHEISSLMWKSGHWAPK